jgi:beta-galactosidase
MISLRTLFFIGTILLAQTSIYSQRVIFSRDFSPAEGLIIDAEKPYREEICLNGYWDIQVIPAPAGWKQAVSPAPELPLHTKGKWDDVKIKIPSAINVNDWGRGAKVGEGTDQPYAPSSVYFPSYPEKWIHARMGWLRKNITLPQSWKGKRVVLYFEAIAGESTLYVNGKEAGKNFDSHLPFEVDITDFVRFDGKNEILVGVRHSKFFDKSHPEYKKFGATYPSGSNTDDLLGIWQDVFLFAVPKLYISDVFVKPWMNKDELELEVKVVNQGKKKQKIKLLGDIKEWINKSLSDDIVSAPEINWELGNIVMTVSSEYTDIKPGETRTITIRTKVGSKLEKWSPDAPNLYTVLLNVNDKNNTYDCKATRFGWRQFTIVGDEFHLNGKKIQCFGDIQHPFSAYICSRRFVWAWYKMIKDFGGNAVRPHAQPWPRVYYDLADEMGLMVLDETALFGSSIRLNLEEEITWQRSQEHLDRLILRDRNHPSVIGWSAGNEMFAIALLNKPAKEVSDKWDEKMVELTLSAKRLDPTRDFLTLDGDRDMDGRFPVWSKHFGHGLRTEDLPKDLNKPLIVGESGATYYGRPIQLYPFVGDKAFESYYGRSEALAIDVYQNAVKMARPHLAYYSPSEVCWFGIEHMNLGYHDYFRLPNLKDGIFAGKAYEEGKPGYQYERIPPYVTTFNPGLDPALPLYEPLPMFKALKAALSQEEPLPCKWDEYKEHTLPAIQEFPTVKYKYALFIGNKNGELYNHLSHLGIKLNPYIYENEGLLNKGINLNSVHQEHFLLIIEASCLKDSDIVNTTKFIRNMKDKGGMIIIMLADEKIPPALKSLIPGDLSLTDRPATALESDINTEWGKYFDLPHLYFAEMEGDKKIIKKGMKGDILDYGEVILTASRTDWSLFNQSPESKKCAQVVLYEHLEKPSGAALVSYKIDNATLVVSTLDYRIETKETTEFWKTLYSAMSIANSNSGKNIDENKKKSYDLLMDGPVD